MLDVLISIRPGWCGAIFAGVKTIELRKTVPNLPTPFKCFIYCTSVKPLPLADYARIHAKTGGRVDDWSKMVIGEFICDRIEPIHVYRDGAVQNWVYAETDRSGLTYEEVAAYIGKEKTGYAWHISDLKIYDQPKPLTDFHSAKAKSFDKMADDTLCFYCEETEGGKAAVIGTPNGPIMCEGAYCEEAYQAYLDYEGFTLTRPPQSWCYVEVPE